MIVGGLEENSFLRIGCAAGRIKALATFTRKDDIYFPPYIFIIRTDIFTFFLLSNQQIIFVISLPATY